MAVTLPEMLLSVKLELVSVVWSMAREKTAWTVAVVATAVALLVGSVEVTVGAELTVVKVQL